MNKYKLKNFKISLFLSLGKLIKYYFVNIDKTIAGGHPYLI